MTRPWFMLVFLAASLTACDTAAPMDLGDASVDSSVERDGGEYVDGGVASAADAGRAEPDAGRAEPDAGRPAADAGGAEPDAGSRPCGSGRPGPSNTGPVGALTVMEGGIRITEPGTVLENVEVHGSIQIRADNVTLRNFRVVGGLYGIQATYGATNVLIENGEVFDSSSAGIYGGGFTARCLNVHDTNGDGFKTTSDAVVEWSWIHHLGIGEGAHADGNQTRGGSNNTFRHNYCDMGVSVEAPYKSNACFMLQGVDGTALENFVIEDNWLEGGNYTIYCSGTTYVRRNRFGRDFRYGLHPRECTEWVDNVWDDDGSPAE